MIPAILRSISVLPAPDGPMITSGPASDWSLTIILEDADLDTAVRGAAFGMFWHSGQVCMAGTRILVADGVYDEFVDRFVDVTNTIKVGNPMEMTTDMGPLVSGAQLANTPELRQVRR